MSAILSAGRTAPTATPLDSPRSMPPPSSAAFCSTSCPTASSGSATTASSPTRCAPRPSSWSRSAPPSGPGGGRHPIARPTTARTVGRAAAPTDRQGCHPVPALWGRTSARRRNAARGGRARRSFSSRPEPMTRLVLPSAPVASPDTPALCLSSLATTSHLGPARCIAPLPGSRLDIRRSRSPTSPCPGAFSPPTSIDHSP
jgi:hypothetical protein